MSKNQKNSHILIVDDTQKNIEFLGTILLQKGYQINVAKNGLQALEIADKVLPDLILLDIMMPELDGFETCKHLKASDKTRNIPIIFLTARTDAEDIVKGFDLGAADYITKPFNSTELLVRVRNHLDLKFSKDLIEKVSSERKELLHILCHDLANPFNVMFSAFKLIEKGHVTFEYMQPHLSSAVRNGIEVIKLVNKMRALEDEKFELESINVSEAIAESYLLLKNRFSEKQIELKLSLHADLHVCAEKTSFINSVLNNILTNAIKFSYRGSKIVVNTRRSEDNLEISIRDFGIGMSEKIQNNLFDLNRKISRQGTEGETGTGFGMPLIRKFIKAYGGTLEIFSKDKKQNPRDHGTEIKITLKLREIGEVI